uniref:Interleukin 31 receptor A n=1 Tax=Cyanoderma ruficeps TaxID=181631 RepID=A0A8C3QMJ8_9PASS
MVREWLFLLPLLFFFFRPDMPENISCIYFYDANLTCTWNAGRETSFATNYTLYRRLIKQVILSFRRVRWEIQKLHLLWFFKKISHISACDFISNNFYSCTYFQEFVNVSLNSIKHIGSCNLTGLWDSTDYSVAIRCINNESAFWSGWSGEKNESTEEEAPSGKVDLWRVIESSHSSRNRSVHLMWKPLKSFPPSGKILGYKIQYFPENKIAHKRTNNSTEKKITLLLNEEAYIISVTAYNSAGESPEAVLRIPTTDEKLEAKLCQGLLSYVSMYILSYFAITYHIEIVCKYSFLSFTENFKPFICYNISVYPIYGNNVAAPFYTQIYAQEKKPSEGPVADTGILGKNEVTIKWNEISKAKRNGFITNYTIFYKPEDGKEFNETVNSDVLQYRLKSLQANTQYTVQIMASNQAGGTIGEQKTFRTLKMGKFKKVCWPDIPNPEESITNRDEKILHYEENEAAKCFSPSMPYITSDQFTRSQMHSALTPVKEVQPIEMVVKDLCGCQQNPIKNEENDDEEVLKLEDFSEKVLFNPYLRNSVKTREFLVSESLPEHSTDECKSQSSVLPPFQPNVPGQSYITLDMFRLPKAQ